MSAITLQEVRAPPTKLFLLGLLSAVFAVNVIDVFAPLLYPEIAATFGITVGTAVQLSAFSSLAGVITGLTMSALSIKIRYKTLLMLGVVCVLFCVLGVFFAPNFLFAQIFYSLNGVGSVMVAVMAPTLIAELYPLEKKAVRVSWIVATAQLALIIGNPVTGLIANTSEITSWKNALLTFMVPVTFVCVLLVIFLVPSKLHMTEPKVKKGSFLFGFKQVISNKSARACLTNSFFAGAFFGINVFQLAFLKDVFAISPALRGLLPVAAGSLLVAGMLTGGYLVNLVGRKSLLVGGAIPAILLVVSAYVLSYFIPNVWIVISLRLAAAFIGGFPLVAGPNLLLEQVPKFRGTMMSLGSAISGIGGAFGIFLGGALLNYFNDPIVGYRVVGVTLGILGLIGCLNILLFAKDPAKNPNSLIAPNLET